MASGGEQFVDGFGFVLVPDFAEPAVGKVAGARGVVHGVFVG